jgi:hypothetical protein
MDLDPSPSDGVVGDRSSGDRRVELAAYADHLKKNILEIVRNCQRPLVQFTAALRNDLRIDEVREGLARDIVVPFRFPTEKAEAEAHHGFLVASQELPVLFGQEEISHAIVPYFLLTVLFGGATTPCAKALAELGVALGKYVDVFDSYAFASLGSNGTSGVGGAPSGTSASDSVRALNVFLKGRDLRILLLGTGFERVIATAIYAFLVPRGTFTVRSITHPLQDHSLLERELLCGGLSTLRPATFPLKYPVAKLVTGDLRHSNLLILPACRSNFAIDFAVACHEEVVDERGNVVVDENGEAKRRRVIVFVQCKDWFFKHPATGAATSEGPSRHTSEGKQSVPTTAAQPETSETRMKRLFEKNIPWLDDELGKIKERVPDVRFTYILAMMNPPPQEILDACVGTLSPANTREELQTSANEDRPARKNTKKERKRSKPLRNIEGVAIMTPERMRHWLPTAAFALDLVHRRNEMLPPLDALVDASGEPAEETEALGTGIVEAGGRGDDGGTTSGADE